MSKIALPPAEDLVDVPPEENELMTGAEAFSPGETAKCLNSSFTCRSLFFFSFNKSNPRH